MAHLLHVSASPRREASFNRRIGVDLIRSLHNANPHFIVWERDLALDPVPHPDEAFVTANMTPQADRGPVERDSLMLSERLITELEEARLVLVSTPIHNLTVPSTLKAWLDHVVRPNRTFCSSAGGKVGLLKDRPVLIVITCGGRFGEDSAAQTDFLTPYLRCVFGMIGLSSVEVLRLDELHRGAGKVEHRREIARRWIETKCRALAPTMSEVFANSPSSPRFNLP